MPKKALTIIGHFPVPRRIQSSVADIEIPGAISYREMFPEIDDLDWKLRDDAGVDTTRLLGHDALICDGYCGWHDDQDMSHRYSLIYVVRNDTNSFVQTRGAPIPAQPPGTLLLLDIWKKHRLNCPGGMKGELGVWFAFCWDLIDVAPSEEECIDNLKKLFSEIEASHES